MFLLFSPLWNTKLLTFTPLLSYGTLQLESGAVVDIYGTANVFGFIDNVAGNEESEVNVYSGASIYQPFVLVDFKGGTLMSGLYYGFEDYDFSPFNQFHIMNVSARLMIDYGANLYTYCNLQAGGQNNYTLAHMVGDGGFIELTDLNYSYLVSKYNPETEVTDLKIYGGAIMNTMSLTINTGIPLIGKVTVTSSDYRFALSWLYHITLDNAEGQTAVAEYTMPNRYKMLPGSVLVVESGATLNVTSLSVYEEFLDSITHQNGTSHNPGVYPSSLTGRPMDPAELIVRGNLVAGDLGGYVYTDVGGATVKVTGKTRITTYEATAYLKETLGGEITAYQTITRILKLVYIDGNSQSAIFPGALYQSYADTKTWDTEDEVELIELTIPAELISNCRIVIDTIMIIESDGSVTVRSYDSAVDGAMTFSVIPGSPVTFKDLTANQLVVDAGVTSLTVTAGEIKTETYDYIWSASTTTPVVYTVPVLTLSNGIGSVTESTIKYVLDTTAKTGYIEMYLKKSASGFGKVSVSFSVTATASTTTGTGSFSGSGYFSCSKSTTVKVYDNDTVNIT